MRPSNLLVTAVLGCLAGCSSLVHETALDKAGQPGVSYFLPKRLHKVSYTVSQVAGGDAEAIGKKYDEALQALASAGVAKQKAVEEEKQRKAAFDQAVAVAGKEGSQQAQDLARRAQSEHAVAQDALALAKTSYDAAQALFIQYGKLRQGIGGDSAQCKVEMSIEAQPLVPDETQPRIAVLRHSYTRDDHLTITTTPSGLLAGANGVATDRTGDILVAVAQAAFALGGGGGVPMVAHGLTPDDDGDGDEPVCHPGKYAQTIDFSDDKMIADFSKMLGDRATGFTLERRSGGVTGESKNAPKLDGKSCPLGVLAPFDQGCDGLAYRRELPYLLELKQGETVADVMMITMPQGSPVAYVPYNVGLFVKNEFNVTFADGMLVSSEVDKPSELLSLAKLPVDMARGVMTVLTDFIQLRVDYTGKQAALAQGETAEAITVVEDQTARVKALADYQKALQELREAAGE